VGDDCKERGDWGEGISGQPIITSFHTTSSSTTLLLNPLGMEYSIMTVLTSVGRVYKHVLGIILTFVLESFDSNFIRV
jgi:hypothetical protein